jgi:hypothetical protein
MAPKVDPETQTLKKELEDLIKKCQVNKIYENGM